MTRRKINMKFRTIKQQKIYKGKDFRWPMEQKKDFFFKKKQKKKQVQQGAPCAHK